MRFLISGFWDSNYSNPNLFYPPFCESKFESRDFVVQLITCKNKNKIKIFYVVAQNAVPYTGTVLF
jgi:hypothetical protein